MPSESQLKFGQNQSEPLVLGISIRVIGDKINTKIQRNCITYEDINVYSWYKICILIILFITKIHEVETPLSAF